MCLSLSQWSFISGAILQLKHDIWIYLFSGLDRNTAERNSTSKNSHSEMFDEEMQTLRAFLANHISKQLI